MNPDVEDGTTRSGPDGPAVRVESLARRFGATRAVDDVSIDVARGEMFGLVGPDGAGKTTTLRMLAGVLPPSSGDAALAGASVARDPEGVKRRIAYMPQRFGLYSDLTVRENLEFYADLHGVPEDVRAARLDRLYRFSALRPFEDRLAGRLSGGMRQKLALSCALIHEPEILLLDEPTFGVDPISRRDLWLILHEMVAQGVTVLLSTSYLDEAERCDRVALLDRGRVIALDAPRELQRAFGARLLVVQADDPRGAADALRGAAGIDRVTLFGDTVHVTLPAGDAADSPRGAERVRQALAGRGLGVRAIDPAMPSLEDVFIDLVARTGREAA